MRISDWSSDVCSSDLRLDHRKAARGSDAERLQHFGREHFAHRALQGEPPVAETAVGSLARTLGAQVRQPSCLVAHLCEQEAPAVPDLGVVGAELMTVIAQGQRLLQAAGKRPELAEMTDPCLVVQRGQPGFGRRPVVAKTQYMRGKRSEEHGVRSEGPT